MNQDFFNAVTQGDAAKVKEMLRADPSLARAKDDNGVSPVLKATYYRKKEVVLVLLASGVELNIFEAAATGQIETVGALIKREPALVNECAPDGFFPLGLAVFFGHLDTVQALLRAGAQVSTPSRESMKVTPLHSAAAAGQLEIAKVLIAQGANVNARAATGFTALHEAAANGDIPFATLLLEHSADVNAKTDDGKTALSFALERNQAEMGTLLKARGGVE